MNYHSSACLLSMSISLRNISIILSMSMLTATGHCKVDVYMSMGKSTYKSSCQCLCLPMTRGKVSR